MFFLRTERSHITTRSKKSSLSISGQHTGASCGSRAHLWIRSPWRFTNPFTHPPTHPHRHTRGFCLANTKRRDSRSEGKTFRRSNVGPSDPLASLSILRAKSFLGCCRGAKQSSWAQHGVYVLVRRGGGGGTCNPARSIFVMSNRSKSHGSNPSRKNIDGHRSSTACI